MSGTLERNISDLTHGDHVCLVSDLAMPGEDGYALIRRVRARTGRWAALPAVALTAFARPDDQRRALAAGFQAHLPKPVEPAALAALVARLADELPT